LYLPLCRGST